MKVEVLKLLFFFSVAVLISVSVAASVGQVGGGGGAGGAVFLAVLVAVGSVIALIALLRRPTIYAVFAWISIGYVIFIVSLFLMPFPPLPSFILSLVLTGAAVYLAAEGPLPARNTILASSAGGMGGIVSMSFGPRPAAYFLLILTAFDIFSVFVTGHMVEIGRRAAEEDLPLLLKVPTSEGYRFLGLGDVFAISVASSSSFLISAEALISVFLILAASTVVMVWTLKVTGRGLPATVFVALPPALLILGATM